MNIELIHPCLGEDIIKRELMQAEYAQGTPAATRLNTSVREYSAQETLRRIQPSLPEFGVRHIVDLTFPGVDACPVFQVMRDDMRSEFFNAGKGFTRAESLVSGLMEAIEVHCYERSHPALLVDEDWLAYQSLSGKAIPVAALGQVDTASRYVIGTEHVSGAVSALPAAYVFQQVEDAESGLASPNGIASGNSVNEALCHALAEMLERHALAGFFQQGSAGNHFRYQALERVTPPPECDRIHTCLLQLASHDISAEFVMISSAANVAVFVCFLDVPTGGSQRGAVHGYGAHGDPRIAMARALGEAVQIMALCPVTMDVETVADTSGTRVMMTSKQAASIDPVFIHRQRLADHALLTQLRDQVELIDYEYMAIHDQKMVSDQPVSTAQALQELIQGLQQLGIERIYSCVISPPHLPMIVVKCFCPGLDCIRGL